MVIFSKTGGRRADGALTAEQRETILNRIAEVIEKHFYDPHLRGIDWKNTVSTHRPAIVAASSPAEFEDAVSSLLSELNVSHLGFYHQSLKRATARMSIGATYGRFQIRGRERWVFQDVHVGGAAHIAGIRSGDCLVSVAGRDYYPPDHPVFPMGEWVEVCVVGRGGTERSHWLDVPTAVRKRNQPPYAPPALVSLGRLNRKTGYIRISRFPGQIGVEVANKISAAVQTLPDVERLIFDLRGNPGGGLAVIRVMSFLTPDKRPIGYDLNRRQADKVLAVDRFPIFDRVPAKTWLLRWYFLKYGRYMIPGPLGTPVMLATEGLGSTPFHGRVVLLVNRHTASASEMIVAFAKEHNLATLVGEPTPGRVMSGNAYKLPLDYRIAMPVGAYHTASGAVLEGTPLTPDVEVTFDPKQALAGQDTQLEKAFEVVTAL